MTRGWRRREGCGVTKMCKVMRTKPVIDWLSKGNKNIFESCCINKHHHISHIWPECLFSFIPIFSFFHAAFLSHCGVTPVLSADTAKTVVASYIIQKSIPARVFWAEPVHPPMNPFQSAVWISYIPRRREKRRTSSSLWFICSMCSQSVQRFSE